VMRVLDRGVVSLNLEKLGMPATCCGGSPR